MMMNSSMTAWRTRALLGAAIAGTMATGALTWHLAGGCGHDFISSGEVIWRIGLLGGLLAALILLWLSGQRLLLGWQANMQQAASSKDIAEDEMYAQRQVLNTIIEHLPVGLFVKKAADDYRWHICNRKAEELFGIKAEELIGTTDFEHFPHHEARFFRDTDERVMREGRVIEVDTEEVTGPHGVWLAHTMKVPIYDQKGEPFMLLGIFEDITIKKQQADQQLQMHAAELEAKNNQLEQAKTRAEEADKAKTHFLATMSHEIRTPLNGVIGTADLMSRTQLSGQQDDYVRTIQMSAEALLYVINDILDLTKLEAGQLGLEKIPFDISRTVEDVMEIHSANAGKKNLDLLLRYAPGTPERLHGDPGRLRQILNNLISNAIKFTPAGHILVEVECADSHPRPGHTMLKISVQDTGIGISAENRERVFERFTQAEASTTRNYGGTGLGLSICKQLVELMGGNIGVESEPGKGSTFWFTLAGELDMMPVPTLVQTPLQGRTVLVVDDNVVNGGILRELLAYWGCAAVTFTDGESALAWVGRTDTPPDIAIIDHTMPNMSGADLGTNLRLHPCTAGMPMVIFSSRGARGDAGYFEEMGFNGYLVKPSRPADLRTMLSALLGEERPVRILTRHILREQGEQQADCCSEPDMNLNVLVVEDDPVNQKVVRMMLEELGCAVHVAASGPMGIEAFKQAVGDTKFDIVLMDMQMPGMDGPEAAEEIRAWEMKMKAVRTPIIALTANAMAEHRERCLKAGMDDYMTKPLTHGKLVEQLSRWGLQDGRPMEMDTHKNVLAGLSAEKIELLINTFTDSARECLTELEKAALFDDTETFKRMAHRLKGAAGTFGYTSLHKVCAEAESEAENVDKDVVAEQIRQALAEVGVLAKHSSLEL